ncbi:hypothetical protein P3U62_08305 [Mammaliicoccus vitulinus]|uniref:hypothetical protein n=1 Tax=Mammaliicoccus vitulinus TaxID=71237 RepID=UPI002B25DD64|nr:hypothetical protein [Mammaliicoccus vitulinus]WQK87052.1 hypothetical protein P3U62_08305 [Mammaliicoccus vitulinus]
MVTIKHTRESIAELEKQLDHYKIAHDKLTAGLKEAVAESIQYKRERDELIEDLSNYRRVLKVFARLIKGKLAINASDRYIQYQHMLDDIGINTDELEAETDD